METIRLNKSQIRFLREHCIGVEQSGGALSEAILYGFTDWFVQLKSKDGNLFEVYSVSELRDKLEIPYTVRIEGLFPHKCPVCGGTGNVMRGFYGSGNTGGSLTIITETEPCRSCVNGIIWG